jgi:hypothetical protein
MVVHIWTLRLPGATSVTGHPMKFSNTQRIYAQIPSSGSCSYVPAIGRSIGTPSVASIDSTITRVCNIYCNLALLCLVPLLLSL